MLEATALGVIITVPPLMLMFCEIVIVSWLVFGPTRAAIWRSSTMCVAARVAFAATPTANRAAPSATPVPHAPRPATPSGHEAPPARDPTAPAEPTRPDSDVEAHVALGHRLSQIGRYEDAIDEFRRAYELRAEPRFLHEIAEIYRRLGATDQARFYYERYLASGAPLLQLPLGVGAAPRARRLRIQRSRLCNAFATAVAIHAARADIHNALGQRALLIQRGEQIGGTRIVLAFRRRRCTMQQRIGFAEGERGALVEVEARLARNASDGEARREHERRAARDVAVADDEEPLHAAILFAEIGLTDAWVIEELGGAPGERDRAGLHDIATLRNLQG